MIKTLCITHWVKRPSDKNFIYYVVDIDLLKLNNKNTGTTSKDIVLVSLFLILNRHCFVLEFKGFYENDRVN